MVKITFPDGAIKEYESGITGIEIAEGISKSLAKDSLAVEVNGDQKDLSVPITTDSTLKIITSKTEEGLEILRHDTAHIFAQAIKELYPEAQITIGPSIENGFYYDLAYKGKISTDDFEKIESKMQEIVKKGLEIKREEWDRDEAIEYFKSIGEHYKAEIISDIPKGETISLYRQGEWADLCRGPHALTTAFPKFFKLTKVAGAYWRGDSNNEMLTRIYGTAWATKKDLDAYLFMLEEAEKRDHRKIGKFQDLFHIQDHARGMVFWHDKGWSLFTTIQNYIRGKLRKVGYTEVNTPVLVDRTLWEKSGHWEKFRENMFTSEIEDKEVLALKPMNCPCHVQIFKQGLKSYRDLPLRMAEFGSCHRYEPSGALHGLMRVRGFTQDDAHIFCSEEQITEETIAFCNLLMEVYKDFGFTDVKVKFSDRPEVRAGNDEVWDRAEAALEEATKATGIEYSANKGEGAFYGPKLEFVLRDAIGRDWQCGTLQVDFILPERLGAEYIAEDGSKKRPVMLHRAILGSFERFIGILIENFAGTFPLWLAPTQITILTITNDADDYAKDIRKRFVDAGIRADIDISSEKINYKVRKFIGLRVPLLAVVGKNEAGEDSVSLRILGSEEKKSMKVDDVISMIQDENNKYLR